MDPTIRLRLSAIPLAGALLIASAWPAAQSSVSDMPVLRAQSRVTDALPGNIDVDPTLRPTLEAMWTSSGTFRRQCRRLVAASHVQVRLTCSGPPLPSGAAARTVIRRNRAGRVTSAHIQVRPIDRLPEQIAHELEHILEQLDDVDLASHLKAGTAWRTGDSAVETRRAIDVGRRVASEMRKLGESISVVRLRDHLSSPLATPSARVSAGGRHVVFASYERLAAGDSNYFRDIYVLDLATRDVTLETVTPGGDSANGESTHPDISADGRYVVFLSVAGNLVEPPLAADRPRVYLRDRLNKSIRLLSAGATPGVAEETGSNPVISADGTTVVFESSQAATSASRVDGPRGIYLIRLATGERQPVDHDGSEDESRDRRSMCCPAVSADGRFVAFASSRHLAHPNVQRRSASARTMRGSSRIYLRDTVLSRTRAIGRTADGRDPNGGSYHPALSGNGRFVAFASDASNVSPGGRRRFTQIYVHDTATDVTALVSQSRCGGPGDGASLRPSISGDGSFIAFQSLAANLLCLGGHSERSDTNLVWDVFVAEWRAGRIVRASTSGRDEWMEPSRAPSLDSAGEVVVFTSHHPIDDVDEGHDEDLYIRVLPHRRSAARPWHATRYFCFSTTTRPSAFR